MTRITDHVPLQALLALFYLRAPRCRRRIALIRSHLTYITDPHVRVMEGSQRGGVRAPKEAKGGLQTPNVTGSKTSKPALHA